VNQINGYYKAGPRTSSTVYFTWNASSEGSSVWSADPKIYTAGNVITNVTNDPNYDNRNLWNHLITGNGFVKGDPLPNDFFVDQMHPLGTDINIKTARESYEFNIVQKNIGSRYYMDNNGERQKYIIPVIDEYIEDAITGSTRAYRDNKARFTLGQADIPDSGEQPYEDSDFDGMADEWERQHVLVVGEKDGFDSKQIWVIDNVTYLNDAGYSNLQIFNDYIHGGFIFIQ
jgi:hypothetical protein